jgi:hypothetical protein
MEESALETAQEHALDTPHSLNPYIKYYIIGGVAGALVGVAGSYLLVRNAQKTGADVEISSSEGLRLALLIFGLLRSIAGLHQD